MASVVGVTVVGVVVGAVVGTNGVVLGAVATSAWHIEAMQTLKPGETAEGREFLDFLDGKIARWWTPDDVIFVDEIPLGPTGKIDKKLLRTRLTGYELPFNPDLKR